MTQIIDMTTASLPERCFVFKHSTACRISTSAATEVREAQTEIPIYWVNVIEQRPLSNWIAEHYGIQHESPQLLLIDEGKVKASWSHRAIQRSVFASAA